VHVRAAFVRCARAELAGATGEAGSTVAMAGVEAPLGTVAMSGDAADFLRAGGLGGPAPYAVAEAILWAYVALYRTFFYSCLFHVFKLFLRPDSQCVCIPSSICVCSMFSNFVLDQILNVSVYSTVPWISAAHTVKSEPGHVRMSSGVSGCPAGSPQLGAWDNGPAHCTEVHSRSRYV
jgi:hypothetical protein